MRCCQLDKSLFSLHPDYLSIPWLPLLLVPAAPGLFSLLSSPRGSYVNKIISEYPLLMPQEREEQKADTEEKRRSLILGTAAQHPCPVQGHGATLQICNCTLMICPSVGPGRSWQASLCVTGNPWDTVPAPEGLCWINPRDCQGNPHWNSTEHPWAHQGHTQGRSCRQKLN